MGNTIARQFRAPGTGIGGWLARMGMLSNKPLAEDAVANQLDLQPGHIVVELGPGDGYAMAPILEKQPQKVYGIEISANFRARLQAQFASAISDGLLTIIGDDAKSLPQIPDKSVDRVFGLNVVYFLAPLDEYMREIVRVLRPGGKVVFGVVDQVKNAPQATFVNTDWDAIVEVMQSAGLDAQRGERVVVDGERGGYWALVGVRR